MNWKEASGREKGREEYVFGDIMRSAVHGLTKIVKPNDSERSNSRYGDINNAADSKNNHKGGPSDPKNRSASSDDEGVRRSRSAQLQELEAFHKLIDGDNVKATNDADNMSCPISVPPVSKISLQGACWPDPDPILPTEVPSTRSAAGVAVDNVTGLSLSLVDRLYYVRTIADIQKVLATACTLNRKVSMRGTKHSMGGQTMAPGGFVIDTAKMNEIRDINARDLSVVVGPGTKWSDLIRELNPYGLSPRTMQSYSSFSIGGTISVNAHGITTDFAMVESVLSLKLVKWDGSVVECAPGADGEAGELFGLAIGGYGMFGVIAEIKLKVVPNTAMALEAMTKLSIDDFLAVYKGVQATDDVEVKIARIDITSFESFQMFVFRRITMPGVTTVSQLPAAPKEMSKTSQLLYKWVMPAGYSVRKFLEDMQGSALDFNGEPTYVTKLHRARLMSYYVTQ